MLEFGGSDNPFEGTQIVEGDEAHGLAAQQALYHRANCNRAARRGIYSATMEEKSAIAVGN